MKAGIIAPTQLIHKYCVTDYHLALAHMVVKDKTYAMEYRLRADQGEHVILDNSVVEMGEPVMPSTLSEAANDIHAAEVIVPDFTQDKEKTLEAAREYVPDLKGRLPEDTRLMVVPQGIDEEQWLECLHEMALNLGDVFHSVGIPKNLGPQRLAVLTELDSQREFLFPFDFHLLGTWGNPVEVHYIAVHFPWVRGVDSKIPVRAGLVGMALHPAAGLMQNRWDMPELRFDSFEDAYPSVTTHNVRVFVGWAKGPRLAEVIPIDGEGSGS
jgi:hypothetical protein